MKTIGEGKPGVELSLSETASLVARAARGAGFAWGEADEIGEAAAWLSQHGASFADALITTFEKERSEPPVVAAGIWQSDGALCPLRTGIALCDFANLPAGLANGALVLKHVRHPLLILPFAARASKALGEPLRVDIGRWSSIIDADGRPMDEVEAMPHELATQDVTITPLTAATARRAPLPTHRCQVTEDQYRALDRLAMKMTVPTSQRSLSGAGASGSDND